VKLSGDGLAVDESEGHPAGTLFSGGYDAERNTVFLAGVSIHGNYRTALACRWGRRARLLIRAG